MESKCPIKHSKCWQVRHVQMIVKARCWHWVMLQKKITAWKMALIFSPHLDIINETSIVPVLFQHVITEQKDKVASKINYKLHRVQHQCPLVYFDSFQGKANASSVSPRLQKIPFIIWSCTWRFSQQSKTKLV